MIIYSDKLQSLHLYIYSFHMPLFFFISGMLYKPSNNLECIKRKFKNLYLPYIFWAFLFIIPYLLFSSKIAGAVNDKANYSVISLIFGIIYGTGKYLPQNTPLWFLTTMFITSIIYNFLYQKFLNKNSLNYIIMAIICISFTFLNSFFKLPVLPLGINIMPTMLIFYLLGNFVYEHKYFINSYIVDIIFIIIGLVISKYNTVVTVMYNDYGNIILFFISSIFTILGYTFLFKKIAQRNLFSIIGFYTLHIMIFHRLFVLLFQSKFGVITKLLRDSNVLIEFFISIIFSLITIVVCIIISITIKKIKILNKKTN